MWAYDRPDMGSICAHQTVRHVRRVGAGHHERGAEQGDVQPGRMAQATPEDFWAFITSQAMAAPGNLGTFYRS